MKTKPSRLSHISLPFKIYRNRLWCIEVSVLFVLCLFTSTLYAITPKPLPTSQQPFLFDTITKHVLLPLTASPTASPMPPISILNVWASDITYNSAVLNGSFESYVIPETVWFEYDERSDEL